MSRGFVTGGIIGVLALGTTALVVLALRPVQVEVPPVAPFEIGAVAAYDDTIWRWVGPTNCNADADVVQMERSVRGGEWATSAIPLSNVFAISFTDDERGVATGNTSECARGVAVTNNGGRTWKYRQDYPVLLDAWYQGNTIWGIERVVGQPVLAAYTVDNRLRFKPVPGLEPIQPCDSSDGIPDQIAYWNDTTGLLFCENDVVGSRLVARTTNGGENFERLADDSPLSGLDGGGSVLDMDVTGTETVWLQITAEAGCSEGQLRKSDSQGAVFTRLPCPSKSVEINEMLDVAFTSETDGVMLALLDRAPVMFVTDDGGASWSTS